MRLFLLLLLIALAPKIGAQEFIAELDLAIPADDTAKKEVIKGKGLYVKTDIGAGFIRLKWQDKKTRETIITDCDIIPISETQITHPITFEIYQYAKFEVTKNIKGKAKAPFRAFDIWYLVNMQTGIMDKPLLGKIPSEYSYEIQSNGLQAPPSFMFEYKDSARIDSLNRSSVVTNYLKLSSKLANRNKLSPYFALWEIGSAKAFTPKSLTQFRKRNYPTIYCITVTDVKDSSIAQNCLRDARAVQDFFRSLSALLDVPYRIIEVKDKNFNVQGVNNAISSIRAKPNDIIVFAYSGHGFSYRNDEEHQFAQMALWQGDAESKAQLRASTINLETIYNRLQRKGNRLNLILGDCCNDYVQMERFEILRPPIQASITVPRWNRIAATKLFIDTKNAYLVGATKKGEKAAAHTNYGGLFTFAFTAKLKSTMLDFDHDNPTWDGIFENTKVTASELASNLICDGQQCQQTLIYKKARR